MKKCSTCHIEKDDSEFSKDKSRTDGLQRQCKNCVKEYTVKNKEKIKEYKKEHCKEYYQKNKEKIDNKNKKWCQENHVRNKEQKKMYMENNKEKFKEYQKEYRKEHKSRIRERMRKYDNNRYQTEPLYRFKKNIRSLIQQGFKLYSKNGKTKSCKEYGIDFKSIYDKIGQKPEGNYHLDHIIPVSIFDFDNPEHVRLSHLPENLRWISAEENFSKNDSIDMQLIRCSLALTYIAQEIGLI